MVTDDIGLICRGSVMNAIDATVLMSVYRGTPEASLKECMASLAAQTRPCPVLLVVDGPVDWNIDVLIAEFLPLEIACVQLPANVGLACALNVGLQKITSRFVFRMDADDVAVPERFAIQMAFAEARGSRFVCSWHDEFGERTDVKRTPTDNQSLHRRLRWHNIISHPTILIEAELLRSVGGYRSEAGRMEDYDLYLRLRAGGVRFDCVGQTLVRVRTDGQSTRRSGFDYLRLEAKLRRRWHTELLLPWPINLTSFMVHAGFRLAPNRLQTLLFRGVRSIGRS